jgi:hypothetical protein
MPMWHAHCPTYQTCSSLTQQCLCHRLQRQSEPPPRRNTSCAGRCTHAEACSCTRHPCMHAAYDDMCCGAACVEAFANQEPLPHQTTTTGVSLSSQTACECMQKKAYNSTRHDIRQHARLNARSYLRQASRTHFSPGCKQQAMIAPKIHANSNAIDTRSKPGPWNAAEMPVPGFWRSHQHSLSPTDTTAQPRPLLRAFVPSNTHHR